MPVIGAFHRFTLFKLHRFVRREKQIAESRFEIAQEETLRYRLRAENLERELSEVQDSMKASRARMEVRVDIIHSNFCSSTFYYCYRKTSVKCNVYFWLKYKFFGFVFFFNFK